MNLEILNKIKEYLKDYHLEYPHVVSEANLGGFEKQDCKLSEFDFEMVKQDPGGGYSGDSFSGQMAFPLGKSSYLIVEYCS